MPKGVVVGAEAVTVPPMLDVRCVKMWKMFSRRNLSLVRHLQNTRSSFSSAERRKVIITWLDAPTLAHQVPAMAVPQTAM